MKTKHALKIKVVLALLIPFVTYSCGGSSAEDISENSASNYKLEVFDSLQFNLLTKDIWVADVNTQTGDILVIQPSPPVAWIYDKSLNAKTKLELPEDHPEGVGSFILSATFFDKDIALMGWRVVNIYDKEFNFKKSMRPHYGPTELLSLGKKNIYQFYNKDDNPQLVTYFGQPQTELHGLLEAYYDEFNIVDIVNPAMSKTPRDTVFKPLGELTPDSRFRSGRSFTSLQPRIDVSENLLFYALNVDTTLFVRSLPEGDIIESYSIPFDEFILNPGKQMGMAGATRSGGSFGHPGIIDEVFHTGEFDLIIYQSGLKRSVLDQFDRQSPDYFDKTRKANYRKYLIVKNGERLNRDLRLNPKVSSIQFVDDDGVFYASQNLQALDKEPKKYTIYKLRIVEDN